METAHAQQAWPDMEMNARIASISAGAEHRTIFAFDVFRWNLRLGFAIAPRDISDLKKRRRRRSVRLSDVPPYLREDVGLPPEEDHLPVAAAIWHLFK